jgi:hypothetical protein
VDGQKKLTIVAIADMSERNQSKTTNLEPQVLEQGDIYFFYRPKKDVQEVKRKMSRKTPIAASKSCQSPG